MSKRPVHLSKGPQRRNEAGFTDRKDWLKLSCGPWIRLPTEVAWSKGRADISCGKCLAVVEKAEGRRAHARRVRLNIRNRDGYWYHCPYCDSRSIYRSRTLRTREQGNVVHYLMVCQCCGHRGYSNHPRAVDQLSPEMLEGSVGYSANVDVQEIIERHNNGK